MTRASTACFPLLAGEMRRGHIQFHWLRGCIEPQGLPHGKWDEFPERSRPGRSDGGGIESARSVYVRDYAIRYKFLVFVPVFPVPIGEQKP